MMKTLKCLFFGLKEKKQKLAVDRHPSPPTKQDSQLKLSEYYGRFKAFKQIVILS